MITEDYVSFEIAKKLKDKGFPLEFIDETERMPANVKSYYEPVDYGYWILPTLSLVHKWLREEKGVHICPRPVIKTQGSMGYIVTPTDITLVKNGQPYGLESNEFNDDTHRYMYIQDTYEDALKIAIEKVLELLWCKKIM